MTDIAASIIDSKIYNGILVCTILCEFLLPWLLQHVYPGYDPKTMVLSMLGCLESPVHRVYNIWLIWIGLCFSFTAIVNAICVSEVSHGYAAALLLSVLIYAVGAGCLSGIFHMNRSEDAATISSTLHNISAMIGFAAFLFSPLLKGLVAFAQNALCLGRVCIAAFVAAVVCFIPLILGGRAKGKATILAYEGLWERAALLCMYVPWIYGAIEKLMGT